MGIVSGFEPSLDGGKLRRGGNVAPNSLAPRARLSRSICIAIRFPESSSPTTSVHYRIFRLDISAVIGCFHRKPALARLIAPLATRRISAVCFAPDRLDWLSQTVRTADTQTNHGCARPHSRGFASIRRSLLAP